MEENTVGEDFETISALAVEEGIHLPDGHIQPGFAYPKIPIDCTELSEYQASDKQLAEYFKKASNMNWSPFLAFLSSTFCAGEKRHRIRAFGICCLISLLFNMLLLLFAGKMQQRPSTKKSDNIIDSDDDEYIDQANRQRIGLLCIGAYISNISLTFTSVCLAMVLRKTYAWFFLLFLPIILAAYYSVAKNGITNGVQWGVVQYESHRSDMSFFFNLSYEITQASFAALSGTLLGYQKQCKDIPVRAPESILLCAAVMGLFLMTIYTVPPALTLRSERSCLVRRINSVTYVLLLLVSVSLFLAVLKISGWHLTVPLIGASAIIIAIAWFASPWLATVAPAIFAGPGFSEQDKETRRIAAGEQSLRWVNFYSVMSGVLMASYSSNIGGGKSLSWQYIASMDFMYSAFWAYMAHILVMREATDYRHAAVKVSSILASAFLIIAVACVALLIVLKPHEITCSFSSGVPVHPCPS